MSWKNILKAQGIEPIIDFIKTEMIPKIGKGNLHEFGTLTGDISKTAMKLLREGKANPSNLGTSQVYDEEDGVSVGLYIDDGFDLIIRYHPIIKEPVNEAYRFLYSNSFDYLNKDPKIVAGVIDEFLKLIGRSGMEHGMTLDLLEYITEYKE
jgi:hypothetical protein